MRAHDSRLLRATNAAGPWTQINTAPLVPQNGQVQTRDTRDTNALFYPVERITPAGESTWFESPLVTSGMTTVYLPLIRR